MNEWFSTLHVMHGLSFQTSWCMASCGLSSTSLTVHRHVMSLLCGLAYSMLYNLGHFEYIASEDRFSKSTFVFTDNDVKDQFRWLAYCTLAIGAACTLFFVSGTCQFYDYLSLNACHFQEPLSPSTGSSLSQ